MNFVEKGVRIFILTTLSINFSGAAELYCIQFTFFPSSWWTRKHEFKYKKKGKKNPEKSQKDHYCSACKNPMKGHKNIKDCPKSKK